MKRCPACNQTYADSSLKFCTNDGVTLITMASTSSDLAETIFAPPPSITEEPQLPPSLHHSESPGWNTPPAAWNTPPTYAPPPQSWQAPGGWQQPSPAPQGMTPGLGQTRAQAHPLAIISLIAGVLSITLGLICGGPIFGITAIALGLVALTQIKGNPGKYSGKGFAIAGVIIGALWALIFVLMMLLGIIGIIAR